MSWRPHPANLSSGDELRVGDRFGYFIADCIDPNNPIAEISLEDTETMVWCWVVYSAGRSSHGWICGSRLDCQRRVEQIMAALGIIPDPTVEIVHRVLGREGTVSDALEAALDSGGRDGLALALLSPEARRCVVNALARGKDSYENELMRILNISPVWFRFRVQFPDDGYGNWRAGEDAGAWRLGQFKSDRPLARRLFRATLRNPRYINVIRTVTSRELSYVLGVHGFSPVTELIQGLDLDVHGPEIVACRNLGYHHGADVVVAIHDS